MQPQTGSSGGQCSGKSGPGPCGMHGRGRGIPYDGLRAAFQDGPADPCQGGVGTAQGYGAYRPDRPDHRFRCGWKSPGPRLVSLGMEVMGIDIAPTDGLAEELGLTLLAKPGRLFSLLPKSDFVISAVTLTPETHGIADVSVFDRMKPTAYFVNISRGPIVNEDDLLSAVNEGKIAGAGLDVLSIEPPTPEHPLINHDRIIITPHTAGVTEQSFSALGHAVADNIARLKEGKRLMNTV